MALMYGFQNLETVLDRRVEDVGVPTVEQAIADTLAEHNRQVNAITSLFVRPTSDYKIRYRTATAARLQPLDQDGRARPIVPTGHYDVAFPLQHAGTAWGANWMARAKMTVQQANDTLATLVGADKRWMRDHILSALFNKTAWTFPDPDHGSLSIQGLANGDSVTYEIQSGAEMGATDDHYYAQAAGIADISDPFPTIVSDLEEHPENSGEIIVLMPTGLKASVMGLTGFVPQPDPVIREGINTRILTSFPSDASIPGEFFGYHDAGAWLATWAGMPAGYMVAVATGGERPIAMREDELADLRGFRKVAEREDYPFWEAQYIRMAGFGGWNRVGAVVAYVGTSGTYAVPSGYSAVMP